MQSQSTQQYRIHSIRVLDTLLDPFGERIKHMNRDTILPYALTTLQRVKDRIFDTNAQISLSGTLVATTTAVSGFTIPSNSVPPGLTAGQAIYGTGIPFGTYIASVSGTTALTLSQAATISGTAVSLTVLNQPTAFDNVLIRMINSCTDWVERECYGRRFKQTLRSGEVYSAVQSKQKYLVAKNCPITYITTSGNMTANSAVVTGIASTAGMQVGMPVINCSNLPPGVITTIVSVDSSTQITLSYAAMSTSSAEFFQVIGLISFEWRAGTPNAPSWTQFVPDQFELVDDGAAGIIRLYGIMPRLYNNMARITYYSGYLIDWENAGNGVTHTLPSDLSNTVENLVVRVFKRRVLAGKGSEALEGSTTSWNREIDAEDRDVLGHYRQVPGIM